MAKTLNQENFLEIGYLMCSQCLCKLNLCHSMALPTWHPLPKLQAITFRLVSVLWMSGGTKLIQRKFQERYAGWEGKRGRGWLYKEESETRVNMERIRTVNICPSQVLLLKRNSGGFFSPMSLTRCIPTAIKMTTASPCSGHCLDGSLCPCSEGLKDTPGTAQTGDVLHHRVSWVMHAAF